MKKILVVDDNPFYAKVLQDKLPKGKYDVLVAQDGEEGIEMVEKNTPDLILLDLKMPKVDGISFLRKIQADRVSSEIPVLIFSNTDKLDQVSESLALGVKGYIVKSLESLERIVESVQTTLENVEKEQVKKKKSSR